MPPTAVILADRHEGVRTALREALEAAGAARVLAEAGTVAAALAQAVRHPGATLVAGLNFPDGTAEDLGRHPRAGPLVVYSWLAADEREADLSAADAVVGLPLRTGLVGALRGLGVA